MTIISQKINSVRKEFSKRQRMEATSSVSYTCDQCLMTIRTQIAKGVAAPNKRAALVRNLIPAPHRVECLYCNGGTMRYNKGSSQARSGRVDETRPYFRVPSRRALARMSEQGKYEAQLVTPQ